MKISAIILTKNEEENLAACLKSLDFCDELVIVDDYSTDKTVSIAKKFNATVYKRRLDDNFATQRSFAVQKAAGDWLLHVDADEQISEKLMKEILVIVMSDHPRFKAYYIKRRDHFFEKIMTRGEVADVYSLGLVRLMIKGTGHWDGEVHEKFVTQEKIGILENYIDHFPHQTLTHFIRTVNYYSSIRANELYKKNHKINILEIIFLPVFKFIYTYVVKLGFIDGAEGFIYSFLMSFHSFLVRAKLQQKWLSHEKN